MLTLAARLLQRKYNITQQHQQQHQQQNLPVPCGIIYVETIQECSLVAEYVTGQLGVLCLPYHSELSREQISSVIGKLLSTTTPMFISHCGMCKEGFDSPSMSVSVIIASMNCENTLYFTQCAYGRVARMPKPATTAVTATLFSFLDTAHILSSSIFVKPKLWANFCKVASKRYILPVAREHSGHQHTTGWQPQAPDPPTANIDSMGSAWSVDTFGLQQEATTALLASQLDGVLEVAEGNQLHWDRNYLQVLKTKLSQFHNSYMAAHYRKRFSNSTAAGQQQHHFAPRPRHRNTHLTKILEELLAKKNGQIFRFYQE